MTAEQRSNRLTELEQQAVAIQKEIRELTKERRNQEQQDCLKWVGRAFKTDYIALLVTSVPPFESYKLGDRFYKYLFPCIAIHLKDYSPPEFSEKCVIREDGCHGLSCAAGEYEEISFSEFQSILNQRINDILKLAATAKMRQQSKEVWKDKFGTIYEK